MAANPFADPSHSQVSLDTNPFADPSIQAASQSTHHEPAYGPSSPSRNGGAGRSDDTAARLEEIRRREVELENRERNLGQREEHVKNFGRNNWPPMYPMFFHSIEDEIPADFQSDVRTIYRGWLLLLIVLLWNMISTILLLTSNASNGGADLGSGIMYVPVIGSLSFLLWYRPVYNAYAKEHSLFYTLYFVFAGFHVAFCVYMFIGIPSTGSAGLINAISAFGRGSIVTGVFGVIATIGWAVLALGNAWMYKAVWKHWGDKGHSFGQAKEELATHGFKAYFGKGNKV